MKTMPTNMKRILGHHIDFFKKQGLKNTYYMLPFADERKDIHTYT